MAILGALFPPTHPYHWTTIGEIDDLKAAKFAEVREFFAAFYHPANASLALAGDIDSEAVLDLVQAYFGDLPPGPPVVPVMAPELPVVGERRLILEDRIELPRVYLAWATPAMFADHDAELDIAADILANGKTSRLYRRMIFEERIAADVVASQNSREIAGFMQIAATATPGQALSRLEETISEEIERLAADGPTDEEMARELVQAEAQFVFRLRNVGGFGGKSDQLNAYNTFLGDPGFFERDLARYQSATARSVRDSVRRYLDHNQRVTLSVVPAGRPALSIPASVPALVA
jgi:zinc protease